MKKRYGLLIVLLCLVLPIVLFSCKKTGTSTTTQATESQATTSAQVPTEASTVPSTTAQTQLKVSSIALNEDMFAQNAPDTKVSSASIRFPKLEGDSSGIMNINSYYANILESQTVYFRNEFYTKAIDHLAFSKENGTVFAPFSMTSDFWVSCNDDKYLSIVRNFVEFTGGNSTPSSLACETFTKGTGSILKLSDFFSVSEELYMKKLIDLVKLQAKNKSDLYDDYEGMLLSNFDQRNFYITNDNSGKALVLVYQPYQIAPGSIGIVDFTISFSQLKDIMK